MIVIIPTPDLGVLESACARLQLELVLHRGEFRHGRLTGRGGRPGTALPLWLAQRLRQGQLVADHLAQLAPGAPGLGRRPPHEVGIFTAGPDSPGSSVFDLGGAGADGYGLATRTGYRGERFRQAYALCAAEKAVAALPPPWTVSETIVNGRGTWSIVLVAEGGLMARRMTVRIRPDGTVEVDGLMAGPSCGPLVDRLAGALGRKLDEVVKPEFHQEETQTEVEAQEGA